MTRALIRSKLLLKDDWERGSGYEKALEELQLTVGFKVVTNICNGRKEDLLHDRDLQVAFVCNGGESRGNLSYMWKAVCEQGRQG